MTDKKYLKKIKVKLRTGQEWLIPAKNQGLLNSNNKHNKFKLYCESNSFQIHK